MESDIFDEWKIGALVARTLTVPTLLVLLSIAYNIIAHVPCVQGVTIPTNPRYQLYCILIYRNHSHSDQRLAVL